MSLRGAPAWAWLGTMATASVMVVLVLSGLGKFIDLAEFLGALRGWRTLPSWLLPAIVTGVPSAEVLVGGIWLLGLGRRWAPWTALLLLALFSSVYVREWASGGPPACGCMGKLISSAFSDRSTGVLARNGVLAGLLAAGMFAQVRGAVDRQCHDVGISKGRLAPAKSERTGSADARAFSLIEVVVAIAVVSILLVLAMPQAFRIRESARGERQKVNSRSNAQVFSAYALDYKGLFPYLTDPRREFTTLRCDRFNFEVRARYFDPWYRWNIGLADGYYNGDMFSEVFQNRDYLKATPWVYATVLYPIVFLMRPEYWNRKTRTRFDEQAGATRDSDVLFPAKKVLLGERPPERLGPVQDPDYPQPLSFVDGHASAVRPKDFAQRGPWVLDAFPQYSTSPSIPWPFFYTLDGVRGRDVR